MRQVGVAVEWHGMRRGHMRDAWDSHYLYLYRTIRPSPSPLHINSVDTNIRHASPHIPCTPPSFSHLPRIPVPLLYIFPQCPVHHAPQGTGHAVPCMRGPLVAQGGVTDGLKGAELGGMGMG